jgi:hypothetical protein
MTRSKDAILQEIARVDAALADNQQQRDEMRARLEALRAELTVSGPSTLSSTPPTVPANSKAPHTRAEKKVRLSTELERGRASCSAVPTINAIARRRRHPADSQFRCSLRRVPGLIAFSQDACWLCAVLVQRPTDTSPRLNFVHRLPLLAWRKPSASAAI